MCVVRGEAIRHSSFCICRISISGIRMTNVLRCRTRPDSAVEMREVNDLIRTQPEQHLFEKGKCKCVIDRRPNGTYEVQISFGMDAMHRPIDQATKDFYVPHGGFSRSEWGDKTRDVWVLRFLYDYPSTDLSYLSKIVHEDSRTYKTFEFARFETNLVVDSLIRYCKSYVSPRRSVRKSAAHQGHTPATASYRARRSRQRPRHTRSRRRVSA